MTRQVQHVPARRRLDLLDYLRLAAAGMVVGYHYLFSGVQHDHIDVSLSPLAVFAKYGYLGVDLFFLISGFVIMSSARGRTASSFAVSRATRLYPAFLPAMLLTALATYLWGGRAGLSVTGEQVLANLTMMPAQLGQPLVDGVYWSLAYELMFYGLVLVLLATRLGRHLGTLMPLWALAMLVLLVAAPGLAHQPFGGGFYAYFTVGAILAEIRHDGRWTPLRVAGGLAGLVVMLHWAVRYADAISVSQQTSISRPLVCLIVLGWVALLATMLVPRVANAELPGVQAVGALTYPVYLLHANLGFIAMSFFISDATKWVVYPVTIAGVLLAAAVVVRVERHPVWRRLFVATLGRVIAPLEARRVARTVERLPREVPEPRVPAGV